MCLQYILIISITPPPPPRPCYVSFQTSCWFFFINPLSPYCLYVYRASTGEGRTTRSHISEETDSPWCSSHPPPVPPKLGVGFTSPSLSKLEFQLAWSCAGLVQTATAAVSSCVQFTMTLSSPEDTVVNLLNIFIAHAYYRSIQKKSQKQKERKKWKT